MSRGYSPGVLRAGDCGVLDEDVAQTCAVVLAFLGLRRVHRDHFAVPRYHVSDVLHDVFVLLLHQQLVFGHHVQQHQDLRRQADLEGLVLVTRGYQQRVVCADPRDAQEVHEVARRASEIRSVGVDSELAHFERLVSVRLRVRRARCC